MISILKMGKMEIILLVTGILGGGVVPKYTIPQDPCDWYIYIPFQSFSFTIKNNHKDLPLVPSLKLT